MFGAMLCALWCVPDAWVFNGIPLCLSRNLLGMECWGCGMTRAFFSLLHGRWEEAIHYNWRCVIVVPMIAYLCIRFAVR